MKSLQILNNPFPKPNYPQNMNIKSIYLTLSTVLVQFI